MLSKEHTVVQVSKTNVYDVMIRLLDSRHYYGERYAGSTGKEIKEDWNALIVGIDRHLEDLKLIATDQYDTKEEA